MRNAAAYDDDYALDQPVRSSKPARKGRIGSKKKPATRGRKGGRRTLHYAAIGLSASLAVGIMVNALVLQHSRHPAPLFGKAIALGDVPAPVVTAPPAAPAASPAPPPTSLAAPAAPAPTQTAAHPRRPVAAEPVSAVKTGHDDPIGKLLRASAGGDKAPDKAGKEDAKAVLATQHALVKLGFVVKPTGTFGPVTKAAIEAFERDQHLPIKGEMSRKVLKQISAESGVAID